MGAERIRRQAPACRNGMLALLHPSMASRVVVLREEFILQSVKPYGMVLFMILNGGIISDVASVGIILERSRADVSSNF